MTLTEATEAVALAKIAEARAAKAYAEACEVTRRAVEALRLARVRADDGLPKCVVVEPNKERTPAVITRRSKTSIWARYPGETREMRFTHDKYSGWTQHPRPYFGVGLRLDEVPE